MCTENFTQTLRRFQLFNYGHKIHPFIRCTGLYWIILDCMYILEENQENCENRENRENVWKSQKCGGAFQTLFILLLLYSGFVIAFLSATLVSLIVRMRISSEFQSTTCTTARWAWLIASSWFRCEKRGPLSRRWYGIQDCIIIECAANCWMDRMIGESDA